MILSIIVVRTRPPFWLKNIQFFFLQKEHIIHNKTSLQLWKHAGYHWLGCTTPFSPLCAGSAHGIPCLLTSWHISQAPEHTQHPSRHWSGVSSADIIAGTQEGPKYVVTVCYYLWLSVLTCSYLPLTTHDQDTCLNLMMCFCLHFVHRSIIRGNTA